MISIRNPAAHNNVKESSSYWMKYETSTQDDETVVDIALPTISKALENLLSNPINFVEAKSENRSALALNSVLTGESKTAGKRNSSHREPDSDAQDSGIEDTNFYDNAVQNKRRKLSTVDEETSDSGYSSLGLSADPLCQGSIHNQLLPCVHHKTYEGQNKAFLVQSKVKVGVSDSNASFLPKRLDPETSSNILPKQRDQNSPSKPLECHVESSRGVKEDIVASQGSRSRFRTEFTKELFNTNHPEGKKKIAEVQKTRDAATDRKLKQVASGSKVADKIPIVFTCGLRNRSGYHCYRNACLQALGNDQMFRERVLMHRCNRAQCSACLLREVFSSQYSSRIGAPANDPRQLPAIAKMLGRPFNSHGQQDCIEYSLSLLNKLEEHGKTDIINMFRGYYSQSLVCKCGKVSGKKEVFRTLNLPMPAGKMQRPELELDDLLKRLVQSEFIKDYRCEGCKKLGVKKQLSLGKLPQTLYITLSRFSSTVRGYQKNTARVKIQALLDLSPYLETTEKAERDTNSHKYKLSAIICHTGSLNSGHYFTYIRPTGSKAWFLCDDSRVDQVSPSQVSQEASRTCYGLLYEKLRGTS